MGQLPQVPQLVDHGVVGPEDRVKAGHRYADMLPPTTWTSLWTFSSRLGSLKVGACRIDRSFGPGEARRAGRGLDGCGVDRRRSALRAAVP